MPKIKESIEVNADLDKVWSVLSDIDHEADYWWGTKDIRNISREGDVIVREITQNFRNHKISQNVVLRPKEEVETQYLKGLTEGTKLVKLEKLSQNSCRVTASWDVHFPGFYVLMSFFIARHVRKGTTDALVRIKDACENVTNVATRA